jgi:hypothetical protein
LDSGCWKNANSVTLDFAIKEHHNFQRFVAGDADEEERLHKPGTLQQTKIDEHETNDDTQIDTSLRENTPRGRYTRLPYVAQATPQKGSFLRGDIKVCHTLLLNFLGL